MPGKVFLKRLVAFSIALFLAVWPHSSVSALTDQMLDKFAANNIMFYDPDERCSNPTRLSGRCGGEVEGNDAMTRMKDAAAKYGEVAINLQLEYGVPWELVFAQMAKESGVGVAGIAKSIYEDLGGYNWLGHMSVYDSSNRSCSSRGKYSIDQSYGPYGDGEGGTRCARVYQSIADMIGGHMFDFMRNGLYDELLTYSSADNWDLDRAGVAFASRYSGYENNTGYWNDLKNFIVKVDEVAAEKGWPTSEDVAKNNNLPVGGRHTTLGDITSEVPNHSLHFDCNGETTSNGTTAASSSWTDGWLTGNLPGYSKEEAGSSMFTTDFPENPDVISINATGSDNESGGSLIDLHTGSSSMPHFTVDLKNNIVSQHGPITKVGSSERGGIEIAVVGYASNAPSADWDINQFTADDFALLAKLLMLINNETSISITNNIASSDLNPTVLGFIQKAIASLQSSLNDPCSTSIGATGDVGVFQEWVLKLAMHVHINGGNPGAQNMTDDYKAIVNAGTYYSGGPPAGIDCGGFVNILMHASGWDENYGGSAFGGGNTYDKERWLERSDSGWTDVTSTIHSNDDMMVGDVLIYNRGSGSTEGHTLVFVGHIPGFGDESTVMASASYSTSGVTGRAPMPDASTSVMSYLSNPLYRVFRKSK